MIDLDTAGKIAGKVAKAAAKTAAQTAQSAVRSAEVLHNLGRSEEAVIKKNKADHYLIVERRDEQFSRGSVYDGNRNKKYRIRTDEDAKRPTIRLYDLNKNELGRVVAYQNVLISTVKYELYQGGQCLGIIKEKNSLRTRLKIEFCNWRLEGTVLGDHYTVTDADHNPVIRIHRAVSERHDNDYIMEFEHPEDEIPGLLLLLTVELSKHVFD